MCNLDDWNDDALYLIVDDMDWKYLPQKKGFLGAQQEFTLTDKYRKKRTVTWGKPTIFLCNPDQDVYYTCDERTWLLENALYYSLNNKLY